MGGRRKKPGHVDVAKLDLGTKRVCPNCGTKYYDLNKDPIICPKCGTHFEAPARTRAAPVAVVEEPAKPAEEPQQGEVEFISLEEADAESGGAAEEEEEEVEIAGQGEDPFLEDEDEGGDDVTSIIGDVDEEEEP
jgi:uncharacterized protein (TIGR02300 family)